MGTKLICVLFINRIRGAARGRCVRKEDRVYGDSDQRAIKKVVYIDFRKKVETRIGYSIGVSKQQGSIPGEPFVSCIRIVYVPELRTY